MRTIGLKMLVVILVVCLTVPVMAVGAVTKAVSISLSCEGDAYYGGEIIVKVTVAKPLKALAGLEFTLSYDPDYVTPQVTENTYENREMDGFFAARPEGWEQYSYHSAEDSMYTFRFLMPENSESYLDAEEELVLEIPFTVRTPGDFMFSVVNRDIVAIGADDALTSYGGEGDDLTVTAASEAEKLLVSAASGAAVAENKNYSLDIEITNLGDTAGIIALEFDLSYDPAVFTPVIKANDQSQMDEFMVSVPQNSWEQMCTLYETGGKYTIRLAAVNCDDPEKAELLEPGQIIKLSVPFAVVGKAGDKGEFAVGADSVVGLNNVMGTVSGGGFTKNVSVTEAEYNSLEDLGYKVEDGYLLYVKEKTNVADFLSTLSSGYSLSSRDGKVTDGYVCTGYVLSDGEGGSYTVVVKGDVDCNGMLDLFDCLYVKAIYYNRYLPTKAEHYAAAVIDGKTVSLFDYLQIKSHHFGKFDINA